MNSYLPVQHLWTPHTGHLSRILLCLIILLYDFLKIRHTSVLFLEYFCSPSRLKVAQKKCSFSKLQPNRPLLKKKERKSLSRFSTTIIGEFWLLQPEFLTSNLVSCTPSVLSWTLLLSISTQVKKHHWQWTIPSIFPRRSCTTESLSEKKKSKFLLPLALTVCCW